MKKQTGFTLIELVVVIVILGILAVTAAPKFLNLQSDARVSVLKGLKGAIKSADDQVYGKAVIQGVESVSDATVTLPGYTIRTYFGHATPHGNKSADGIAGVGDIALVDGLENFPAALVDNGQWVLLNSGTNDGIQTIVLAPHGVYSTDAKNLHQTKCTLTYMVYRTKNIPPKFILNDEC